MKKRNSVVVLSSDDEDNESSSGTNRSYSKPKSRPLITRTNPRESKKSRLSGSRTHVVRESRNIDDVGFPTENFAEYFYGSKVSAGTGRSNLKELWVDKYKPHSMEELAVHKKKVEEVKVWFEERLTASKEILSNVIVITGQAGIGKSATIYAIASHFGATVCEWKTPTPTVWQEHMHNSTTGINYTSKLDEFVNYIEKIRKYGVIPSLLSPELNSPIILLIDDLPVAHGSVAFGRLKTSLILLVRSARTPTVILLTDNCKTESADQSARYLEELQLSLQSAGACKVSFNPITNNSIKKALTRICKQEQCNVTSEQIDLIAKASGGDIRHAITSLQLFCGFASLFGRDETLSLFHALGKFLHNKRETEVQMALDQDEFLVRDKFFRLPLKMGTPEKVLCQAHGQARPIADFLQENVLDFIGEEAMDAAGDVASYLSDADLLLSSSRGTLSKYNEAENILQSAAASVAVRGILFGNSHPSPSRWHAIRKPKLWQVEHLMLQNQKEAMEKRFIVNGGCSFSNVLDIATEYTPVLKRLGHGHGVETHKKFEHHNDGSYDEEQISEDEIEDW
ncbi:cell cycle checkpoint protein RAD17 isoform X2 [Euphorbia lathyris]|uniref:cell cycle checkpoint protein RAD17 isoform X2 n=1 Tax=Euphorbia lathyris TaxID=212925 RepID=UPI00331342F1